jgi:WD40 repeat protein
MAFGPDGKTLVAIHYAGWIRFWDIERREVRNDALDSNSPFIPHSVTVNGLALSADGKTLATSDDRGQMLLWDVATAMPRSGLIVTGQILVDKMAFSPDSSILASGVARMARSGSGAPKRVEPLGSRSRAAIRR